jgi:hypothetical protein
MSSMSTTPEPIHLSAQHVRDGVVKVVRGDEVIVPTTNSADFVKDAIRELKLRGVDHDTQVVIYGLSNNPAYNGAIKHHSA